MSKSKHGDTVIPFGKHRGKTIDMVAKTNARLRPSWTRVARAGIPNRPAAQIC